MERNGDERLDCSIRDQYSRNLRDCEHDEHQRTHPDQADQLMES